MEMTFYEPGTPSWIDLGSPDPEVAADFYGGLFGWEVRDMGPETAGYRLCLLRGQPVAGLGPQQQPDAPPYWMTYIAVADADATARAVAAAGGQVVVAPMDIPQAGRMAVFSDPAGAPFSVWQARERVGAGLVDETGTFCWNELTTRDVDEEARFYGEVLGWRAVPLDMGAITYHEWRLGERAIGGMMPMDDSWPAEAPTHWMVYFAVDDTDAAAQRVTDLGGAVSVPPADIPPGRFAVVNDPHGAVFSLIKLAVPAPEA